MFQKDPMYGVKKNRKKTLIFQSVIQCFALSNRKDVLSMLITHKILFLISRALPYILT